MRHEKHNHLTASDPLQCLYTAGCLVLLLSCFCRAEQLLPQSTSFVGSEQLLLSGPALMDEFPRHSVSIASLWIDATEIQAGNWSQVCAFAAGAGYDLTEGVVHPADGYSVSDVHPIAGISWYDAVKWCNARSEKDGLSPVYYTDSNHTQIYRTGVIDLSSSAADWDATGYRLPTEAEWETAARGGIESLSLPWATSSNQYFDLLNASNANFSGSGSRPTGAYAPNTLGLSDMGGNVSEWCWDWFDQAGYSNRGTSSTEAPPLADRVTRGGSWFSGVSDCRCSARSAARPADTAAFQGFRTVRKVYLETPTLEINGTTLTWDPIPGANQYTILCCAPAIPKTNLLITTTNCMFTDSQATPDIRNAYYILAAGPLADSLPSTAYYAPLTIQTAFSNTILYLQWPSHQNEQYTISATHTLCAPFTSITSPLQATPPQNSYAPLPQSSPTFYRVEVNAATERQ